MEKTSSVKQMLLGITLILISIHISTTYFGESGNEGALSMILYFLFMALCVIGVILTVIGYIRD